MKTSILYTRKSPREKGYINSIEIQKEKMQVFCKDNDIKIVGHFEDTSEGWYRERPALARLTNYLKEHQNKIDFFLVSDWHRLSTDPNMAFEIIMELSSKYKVTPQATGSFVNYDSPNAMRLIAFQIINPQPGSGRILDI